MNIPKCYIQRSLAGQNPVGIYTNIWPTTLCRIDRDACGGWYLCVHLGQTRLSLYGGCR